ncbi:MAG: hypothetical protein QM765_16610 [Myxococcales bacterium]
MLRTKLKFVYYVLFGVFILLDLGVVWLVERFRPKVTIRIDVGEAGRRYVVVALPRPIEEGVPGYLRMVKIATPGESFQVALPVGEHWIYAVALDLTNDRVRDLKNAQALMKLDPGVALALPGNPVVARKG